LLNENTSGHGEFAIVPAEINGWNWGAFWLTWIWGIANKSYISFLVFLPVANIIMPFYLGARGNELAWKNTYWNDVEEFKTVQKKWSRGAWIYTIIVAVLFTLGIVGQSIENRNMDRIKTRLTNEIFSAVKNNEEAWKMIGDNYTIFAEPALGSVGINNKNIPTDITIIVNGVDEPVMIYAPLDENYNIKEIRVNPFDQNKTNGIIIINN
jgi:hypothetical protein